MGLFRPLVLIWTNEEKMKIKYKHFQIRIEGGILFVKTSKVLLP